MIPEEKWEKLGDYIQRRYTELRNDTGDLFGHHLSEWVGKQRMLEEISMKMEDLEELCLSCKFMENPGDRTVDREFVKCTLHQINKHYRDRCPNWVGSKGEEKCT